MYITGIHKYSFQSLNTSLVDLEFVSMEFHVEFSFLKLYHGIRDAEENLSFKVLYLQLYLYLYDNLDKFYDCNELRIYF